MISFFKYKASLWAMLSLYIRHFWPFDNHFLVYFIFQKRDSEAESMIMTPHKAGDKKDSCFAVKYGLLRSF